MSCEPVIETRITLVFVLIEVLMQADLLNQVIAVKIFACPPNILCMKSIAIHIGLRVNKKKGLKETFENISREMEFLDSRNTRKRGSKAPTTSESIYQDVIINQERKLEDQRRSKKCLLRSSSL